MEGSKIKSKGKKTGFTQPLQEAGFTIIELLTVLSIIVILISLLVPSLNMVRRYSRVVRQKGQFHNIGTGLEMFKIDFDQYPDSSAKDIDGDAYCGAMKLCEAMVGQDGLGFHLDSRFKSDDTYPADPMDELYPFQLKPKRTPPYEAKYIANLKKRKAPYVEIDKVQVCIMYDYYGNDLSSFRQYNAVLSDVFTKQRTIAEGREWSKMGMPILYYTANVTKLSHNLEDPDDADNIYDYRDNDELVKLGLPKNPSIAHPMASEGTTEDGDDADAKIFYKNTWNKKVFAMDKPYNPDTYILLSAGWDEQYGTKDDVFNFAR